jgi:hypothetical protein
MLPLPPAVLEEKVKAAAAIAAKLGALANASGAPAAMPALAPEHLVRPVVPDEASSSSRKSALPDATFFEIFILIVFCAQA